MVTKHNFGRIALGAFISIKFLFLVMNKRKVIITENIEKKMLANIVTTFDHVS